VVQALPAKTIVNVAGQTIVNRTKQTIVNRAGQTVINKPGQTIINTPGETIINQPATTIVNSPATTLINKDSQVLGRASSSKHPLAQVMSADAITDGGPQDLDESPMAKRVKRHGHFIATTCGPVPTVSKPMPAASKPVSAALKPGSAASEHVAAGFEFTLSHPASPESLGAPGFPEVLAIPEEFPRTGPWMTQELTQNFARLPATLEDESQPVLEASGVSALPEVPQLQEESPKETLPTFASLWTDFINEEAFRAGTFDDSARSGERIDLDEPAIPHGGMT
jgi:hypothetical protein